MRTSRCPVWLRVVLKVVLAACLVALGTYAQAQTPRGGLLPPSQTLRFGLVPHWAVQATVDGTRDRVLGARLQSDLILLHTELGTVHVLDAETGQTLWTKRFNAAGKYMLPPTASGDYVGVIHGERLYVVARDSGQVLKEVLVEGVAGGPPTMSDDFIYVPTLYGGLRVFPSGKNEGVLNQPWRFAAGGPVELSPIVTQRSVIFASKRGHLLIGDKHKVNMRIKFMAEGTISAEPAARPPLILVASREGVVTAVHEESGLRVWRFPVGRSVVHPPAVIDDDLFVLQQTGGMFCLEAQTGREKWWAPGAQEFLAASPTRLYVADARHSLVILNRQGARLAEFSLKAYPLRVFNAQTDRIYFGTPTGLLLCLREAQAEEPVRHNQPPKEEPADQPATQPADQPPAEQPAGDPFAEQPAAEPAEDMPADKPAADEPNPFEAADPDDPFK